MLLSGDWNSLMRQISLPCAVREWDPITMMKRTERHQSLQYDISASAEVLIRDQPGIVSQCTQFFSDHGWDIQAMQTVTLEQQPFNLLRANFQLNLSKQGEESIPSRLRRLLSRAGRRVVRIHRQSQIRPGWRLETPCHH